MDDAEKMVLALNSDFDATLLDCWESKAAEKNESKGCGDTSTSQSPRSDHTAEGAGGGVSWDSNSGFARLPSFTTAEADVKSSNEGVASNSLAAGTTAATPADQPWQATTLSPAPSNKVSDSRKPSPVPVSTSTSVALATTKGGSYTTPLTSAPNKGWNQNWMMELTDMAGSKNQMTSGMEASSASLQSNYSATSLPTSDASNSTQMHPLAISSSANCPPHVVSATHQAAQAQMQTAVGMQNALFPIALTAFGGSTAAALAAAGLSPPTSHLAGNQENSRLSQQAQEEEEEEEGKEEEEQQQHSNSPYFPPQSMTLQGNLQHSNSNSSLPQQQMQRQQVKDNSNVSKNSPNPLSLPPFYLFDAPVELRVNFLQSQRMHGIPVTEDSNSYHYGVAVNGFHPQLNSHVNPANAAIASGGSSSSGGSQNHSSVQLVDGRHTNRKAGRIKNEREQRRAQKITELIDQLREKIETGGWKVEVKSKFHTLSSCADYVKHLIKVTKEKEDAVNKAKSDLQMQERKVEEDKALQESRSDPESVMSSLTSCTGDSGDSSNTHHAPKKVSSEHSSSEEEQRKRKSCADDTSINKKRKSNSFHSGSSESSGKEPKRLNHQSLGKAMSSISDITDSNKGSSKSGSEAQSANLRSDDDDESGTPSTIAASSSAAVVQGRDDKSYPTMHADVVIKERSADHRRKFPTEVTSLEESFVLDYEEVFVKSNVPQLIATTAGMLIAWNEFFLKATGISKSAVKGLTIFSLVKQEKLSNLFEIVAKALKKDAPISESSMESNKWDYATMTLPCIDFPSTREGSGGGEDLVNQLYITVTLMADEDPRKRLFHCVFTDCRGTDGALGSITPKLLSMLFTSQRKSDTASESRKGEKATKNCH